MSVNLKWNGASINQYMVSYRRDDNLCASTSMIEVSLVGSCPIDFDFYDVLELYEDGNKKGTYSITAINKALPGYTIGLVATNSQKKLENHFIEERYPIIDTPFFKTRYWIEKFMTEAGVDYSFTAAGDGEYLPDDTVLGGEMASDVIVRLLQYSGWYLRYNENGTAIVGNLDYITDYYSLTVDDSKILDIQTREDDKLLRNRAVVWGMGSSLTSTSSGWIFADISTQTPWNYDARDKRAVVIANQYIADPTTAYSIAGKVLKEFTKPNYVKDVKVAGFVNTFVGDRIHLSSKYINVICTVTTMEVNYGKDGYMTSLGLDERCPKMIGYFNYGGYVYIGTSGTGVWRKPMNYNHVWENFSVGLGSDLIINDLSIANGTFACVTEQGNLYTRFPNDTAWARFGKPYTLKETVGNTYVTILSGHYNSCAVDRNTSHIFAGYNNGAITQSGLLFTLPENPMSWIADISSSGVVTYTNVAYSGFNNMSVSDLDNNGYATYLSALAISSGIGTGNTGGEGGGNPNKIRFPARFIFSNNETDTGKDPYLATSIVGSGMYGGTDLLIGFDQAYPSTAVQGGFWCYTYPGVKSKGEASTIRVKGKRRGYGNLIRVAWDNLSTSLSDFNITGGFGNPMTQLDPYDVTTPGMYYTTSGLEVKVLSIFGEMYANPGYGVTTDDTFDIESIEFINWDKVDHDGYPTFWGDPDTGIDPSISRNTFDNRGEPLNEDYIRNGIFTPLVRAPINYNLSNSKYLVASNFIYLWDNDTDLYTKFDYTTGSVVNAIEYYWDRNHERHSMRFKDDIYITHYEGDDHTINVTRMDFVHGTATNYVIKTAASGYSMLEQGSIIIGDKLLVFFAEYQFSNTSYQKYITFDLGTHSVVTETTMKVYSATTDVPVQDDLGLAVFNDKVYGWFEIAEVDGSGYRSIYSYCVDALGTNNCVLLGYRDHKKTLPYVVADYFNGRVLGMYYDTVDNAQYLCSINIDGSVTTVSILTLDTLNIGYLLFNSKKKAYLGKSFSTGSPSYFSNTEIHDISTGLLGTITIGSYNFGRKNECTSLDDNDEAIVYYNEDEGKLHKVKLDGFTDEIVFEGLGSSAVSTGKRIALIGGRIITDDYIYYSTVPEQGTSTITPIFEFKNRDFTFVTDWKGRYIDTSQDWPMAVSYGGIPDYIVFSGANEGELTLIKSMEEMYDVNLIYDTPSGLGGKNYVWDVRSFSQLSESSGYKRKTAFITNTPYPSGIGYMSLLEYDGVEDPYYQGMITNREWVQLSGSLKHLEVTNSQDEPYFFVSTSGRPSKFYQKYGHSYGRLPLISGWQNYSATIPSGEVTIIRVDDLL